MPRPRSPKVRLTCDKIVAQLDVYAHGMAEAKRTLASAVLTTLAGVQRTNIALVAPTGAGKTYLASALGSALETLLDRKVPILTVDATKLVPPGYHGLPLDEVLEPHAGKKPGPLLAGIILIDEIDKLGAAGEARFRSHAESSLLTLLNGDKLTMSARRHMGPPHAASFDASRWLVICTGAFSAVRERIHSQAHPAGFTATARPSSEGRSAVTMPITLADLRKHGGLMAETWSRIHVMAELPAPTQADFESAAMKNTSLRAVATLADDRRVQLTFGASFFKAAAEVAAASQDSGYRALHAALHSACSLLTNSLLSRPRLKHVQRVTLTRADYLDMQAGTWSLSAA